MPAIVLLARSTIAGKGARCAEAVAGKGPGASVLVVEQFPYEDLTATEIRSRYPQWRIDDDVTGMYQEAGGLIDIRKSVAAHTSLALANGVEFLPHTR